MSRTNKISRNNYAQVDYSKDDKLPTITGISAGTTYLILSLAKDPLSVTSIKIEVRPAGKTNGTNVSVIGVDGGMYQGLYDDSLTKRADNSVAYPQVVAGSSFTAALAGDGTVWTWGSNE